MRRKRLPAPPDDLAALQDARAAVPLVPDTVEDCCDRLRGRLGLPSREAAATWLDLLEGLGLVSEGPAGYSRVREAPDDEVLAERFRETWYGAEEVIAVLADADGSIDARTVAERTEGIVTPWERRRHGPDWRDVWRTRTADLLEWLVLFGLLKQTTDGYRAVKTD